MYDKHLDGFMRVAECGSFSKAAEQLYVSPNALIKQMNCLERDMGAKLLVRTNRGVTLTEAGQVLFESARPYIAESKRIMEKVRKAASDQVPPNRLASSQFFSTERVLGWWRAIEAEHPGIRIEMVPVLDDIQSWPRVFEEIGTRFDVAPSIWPHSSWQWFDRCELRGLYKVPLICAVPRGHRLAGRNVLALDDLRGERVRVVRSGATPSVDELRDHMRSRFPDIEIVDAEPYDIPALNQAAREGTIMILSGEHEGVHPDFVYAALEGDWSVTVCLMYPADSSAAVREFVDAVTERAQQEAL